MLRTRNLLLLATAVGAIGLLLKRSQPNREPPLPEIEIKESEGVQPDADMQAVLTKLASFDAQPIDQISAAEARLQPTIADAVMAVLTEQESETISTTLVPGVESQDITVPGAASSLAATVYTPEGLGPFPVILYFHGGGWVFADRKVYDAGARGLSKQASAVVVSVDYRLAPEHKFPAAHEDSIAVYRWLTSNAEALNGDPTRLGIAGESAGGNLAVSTAIEVARQGLTTPKHVLAIYPVAQPDTETESYLKYAEANPLSRQMMLWFISQATSSPADVRDIRLDLVRAELGELPAVTIINAEIDPLRDDGALLERAIRDGGGNVERQVYSGVTHEFFGTAAVVKKAQQAQEYAGQRMRADL